MSFRNTLPFSSDDHETKTVEKPKGRSITSVAGSYARPRGSQKRKTLATIKRSDNDDEVDEIDEIDEIDDIGIVEEEEAEAEEDNSDQGDMFQAVRIIKQKRNKFLVEWAGIDPRTNKPWEPTWEPYDHCNVLLMEEWELLKASKAEEEKKKKEAHEGKSLKDKRKRESTSSTTSTVPPKRTRTSLPTASTSQLSPQSKPTSSSSSIRDFFDQSPSKIGQRSTSKSNSSVISSKPVSSNSLASTPKTTRLAQPSSVKQSSKKKLRPSPPNNNQTTAQRVEDEVIIIDEADLPEQTSEPLNSQPSVSRPLVNLPASSSTSSETHIHTILEATDQIQPFVSENAPHSASDNLSVAIAADRLPSSPSPQLKPPSDKPTPSDPITKLPLVSKPIASPTARFSAKGSTAVPPNVPSFPFSVAAPKANSVFASVTQRPNQESSQGNSSKGTIVPDSQATSSIRSQPSADKTAPYSQLFASVSNPSTSFPSSALALDTTVTAPSTASVDSTSTSDITLTAASVTGQSKEQGREPMSSQIEEFTPPNHQESSQPTPSAHEPKSEKASTTSQSESISDSTSSDVHSSVLPNQPSLNTQSAVDKPSQPIDSKPSDVPHSILSVPQSKTSSHQPPPTFRPQATTSVINKTLVTGNSPSVTTTVPTIATSVPISYPQTLPVPQKNLTNTTAAASTASTSQEPDEKIAVDESIVKDSQVLGPSVDEEDRMSVISIEDADESKTVDAPSYKKPEAEPNVSAPIVPAAVPSPESSTQIRLLKSELSAINKANAVLEEQNTVLRNRLKSTEDDNEFIKDQYRTSSDRAVSAARELQQAESTIAKLESQVKLGVQQMNLMFQSQVNVLTKQVTQLRAQKELLLEQAALTDGGVRERAARAPVLEREVELLKTELEETRQAAEEAEDSVEALQLEVRRLRALNRQISPDDVPSEAESEGNMDYLPVDEPDDESYRGRSSLPDRPSRIGTRRTAAAAAAAAVTNNVIQSTSYPATSNGTVQTLAHHLLPAERTIPTSPPSPASSVLDLTTATLNDPSAEFNRPPSESLPPSPGLEFIAPGSINPLFLQRSHPHPHRLPTRSISPVVNARDETESLEPEFLGGLPPVVPVEVDDDGQVGGSTVGRDHGEREPLPDKVFQCQWQTVDGESCDILAPSREALVVHMMAHGIHLST
ncbi:Chromo domain/shadow [Phaffia rhodozyma]|uniref:Chromo domain/shadow n=1 Tax=Phaffia rhodozyma TaxID=264483 RepID=A0A0F7SIJ7_PHARH|nr:Chromo domain/shadow [Phaffia rhodozyma]